MPGHSWMVDVLNDLRLYAERNGLDSIARDVGRAERRARAELCGEEETGGAKIVPLNRHDRRFQQLAGPAGARRGA